MKSDTAWMKPGRILQSAIPQIIAESPRRDSRGRFVRHLTPTEIVLKSLRKNYPPQSLPTEVVSAGSGCDERPLTVKDAGRTWPSRFPVGKPLPSLFIRSSAGIVAAAAFLAATCAETWLPESQLIGGVAMAACTLGGLMNFYVAMGIIA